MNSAAVNQMNESSYYPNNQYSFPPNANISNNLPSQAEDKFSFRKGIDNEDDVDSDGGKEGKNDRRKIKIEYIKDKSRRHITFSKRKAGIMKKAYELSTLTGTQVLLLVVSETGLVYTFTTPKLQAIVTKPEGKGLIQACLNAPDHQIMQLEAQRAAAAAANYHLYNEANRTPNRMQYDNAKSSPDKGSITPGGIAASSMGHGYFGYGTPYGQSNIQSPTPLSINTNINGVYQSSQISPYNTQGFHKMGHNGTNEYWSSQASPLQSPGIVNLPGKMNKDN